MPKTLKLAIGQMCGLLRDLDTNMATACSLSENAADQGARVIILPEGCLTGNAFAREHQPVLTAEPATFGRLREIATRRNITICAGFAIECEDKVNIVYAIVAPAGSVLFQHKATRTSMEPEFLVAWPDATRQVFDVGGVRTVVVICSEDGASNIVPAVSNAGPELILHCSAGSIPKEEALDREPTPDEQADHDAEMLKPRLNAEAKVKASGIARAGCNQLGFDGQTYWPGNSFAVDHTGETRLWLKGTKIISEMQPVVQTVELAVS